MSYTVGLIDIFVRAVRPNSLKVRERRHTMYVVPGMAMQNPRLSLWNPGKARIAEQRRSTPYLRPLGEMPTLPQAHH